ncbi:unnamed protein product [Cochlearia groenlandica]
MEEFKHMIVDDFSEEDFYEKIEAPKFVDLTAPDHRPEGEDRYWFCSRVGCDQKHEEFMDSEVIYKNFLLRVMAARSPSVRLRKALYRKDLSVEPPKCPNTVPAKPSRSRVSRLAMISSIPQKPNGNIKPKGVKAVPTSKNATLSKGKDSTLISSVPRKALTERKKQMQSPSGFRSVQNPRIGTVKPSGNRVVAKALVFHSPKKVVKLKRSVELSSSVKKLCSGMRKLEIEKKRDGFGANRKDGGLVPTKRTLKGREVKSRVFDSLRSHKQIDSKAKQMVKEKEEHVVSSEKTSGDEEFVVGKKSEEVLETLKTNMDENFQAKEDHDVIKKNEHKENVLPLECENKENVSDAADADRDDFGVLKESGLNKAKKDEIVEVHDKENAANAANVDGDKESGLIKATKDESVEIEDKENALVLKCDHKENATNAMDVDREGDDKENSSTLDNNRKVNQATNPPVKRKVFDKKETCKTIQKAMEDKCFNGKIVSANTRVKYAKPKLTHPKPFRLRTDERSILKEANTEKKPHCALAKEEETTNILRLHGENMDPKHQPHRLEKNTTSRLKACKGTSTTLDRHVAASENTANGKRVLLGKKKQVAASKRAETMEKKTSPMNEESKGVAIINKSSYVSAVASGEKRLATVPKGPNFHRVHVPKSCTKRVASQQV